MAHNPTNNGELFFYMWWAFENEKDVQMLNDYSEYPRDLGKSDRVEYNEPGTKDKAVIFTNDKPRGRVVGRFLGMNGMAPLDEIFEDDTRDMSPDVLRDILIKYPVVALGAAVARRSDWKKNERDFMTINPEDLRWKWVSFTGKKAEPVKGKIKGRLVEAEEDGSGILKIKIVNTPLPLNTAVEAQVSYSDSANKFGVARHTIDALIGGSIIAQAQADDDGRFELEIDASQFGKNIELVSQAVPDTAGILGWSEGRQNNGWPTAPIILTLAAATFEFAILPKVRNKPPEKPAIKGRLVESIDDGGLRKIAIIKKNLALVNDAEAKDVHDNKTDPFGIKKQKIEARIAGMKIAEVDSDNDGRFEIPIDPAHLGKKIELVSPATTIPFGGTWNEGKHQDGWPRVEIILTPANPKFANAIVPKLKKIAKGKLPIVIVQPQHHMVRKSVHKTSLMPPFGGSPEVVSPKPGAQGIEFDVVKANNLAKVKQYFRIFFYAPAARRKLSLADLAAFNITNVSVSFAKGGAPKKASYTNDFHQEYSVNPKTAITINFLHNSPLATKIPQVILIYVAIHEEDPKLYNPNLDLIMVEQSIKGGREADLAKGKILDFNNLGMIIL
jgi:hypothetical protein